MTSIQQNYWHNWGREVSKTLALEFQDWSFDAITCVICCKNKEKELGLVLPALHNQVEPAARWILADDYSDDQSKEVFVQFCNKNSIDHLVLSPPQQGVFQLNTLRNLGFQQAVDGVVVVIDADLIVGPGFFQAHARLHRMAGKPVSSVGPLFEAADPSGGGPINFMWGHEGWAHVSHTSTSRVPSWATVLGGNLGLHRRTWATIGHFDVNYDGYYGVDDQDLHYRLHLAGLEHVGHFDAHVIHLPHDNAVSKTRQGDINLKRFERKYGLSVYNGRNIPGPIDWLGWQQGPWNKVAGRLQLGDPQAVRKRGIVLERAFPMGDFVILPEHIAQMAALLDENYVRRQADTRPGDLLNAFLYDQRFFDVAPNCLIDMEYVRRHLPMQNPQMHPFALYIASGLLESKGPCLWFHRHWYARTAKLNAGDSGDPFIHFWLEGRFKGIAPHPLCVGLKPSFWLPEGNVNFESEAMVLRYFDVDYYRRQAGLMTTVTRDVLHHYLSASQASRRSPNPFVNLSWLQSNYAHLIPPEEDPLTWFLVEGAKLGASPSPAMASAIGAVAFGDRERLVLQEIALPDSIAESAMGI